MNVGGTVLESVPVAPSPGRRAAAVVVPALLTVLAVGWTSSPPLPLLDPYLLSDAGPLVGSVHARLAVQVGATVVALAVLRGRPWAWPWLLVAGAAALAAGPAARLVTAEPVLLGLQAVAHAAPVLLLTGFGGAVQALAGGHRRAAAAVGGAALGVFWVSAALTGWFVERGVSGRAAAVTAVVLGIAGAVATATAAVRWPADLPGPADRTPRPGTRVVVGGGLAVLALLVAGALGVERLAAVAGVPALTVQRHEAAFAGALGLAVLGWGLVAAAVAGLRALVATVLLVAVEIGAAAAAGVGTGTMTSTPPLVSAVAVGAVAGLALLRSAHRELLAAAAALVVAGTLVFGLYRTGGALFELLLAEDVLVGSVLVAGAVAAVVATAGCAGLFAAGEGSAAAMLGPLQLVVLTGAGGALHLIRSARGGMPRGMLVNATGLGVPAVVLFGLAAAGLLAVAVAAVRPVPAA